jgi:hypothetical protein
MRSKDPARSGRSTGVRPGSARVPSRESVSQSSQLRARKDAPSRCVSGSSSRTTSQERAEHRAHRDAGLLQMHGGLGGGQLNPLDGGEPELPVVKPWREARAAVGQPGIDVGLVHRLPAAHEVAERLRHEVDMATPVLGPIDRHGERTLPCEPTRQGEVVQAHPGCDAGVTGGAQHGPVVRHGPGVVHAFLGLEARPLEREPVMGQAQRGEAGEVLCVEPTETVALARFRSAAGALPVPPVRSRRSALALGRRRARSPPEAVGPLHDQPRSGPTSTTLSSS